jgi:hypothetical protein
LDGDQLVRSRARAVPADGIKFPQGLSTKFHILCAS